MKYTLILFAIAARLMPHAPNFTPLGAMALFSGANYKRYSFLITLVALLISDYLLLYVNPFSKNPINISAFYSPTALFHSTSIFVYFSFLLNVLIGRWIAKNQSANRILTGSLFASLQFFAITNFGVWASGMYSRGFDGLLQSYAMGLPFFKWTILGDLFYTGIFFGTYQLATRISKKHAFQTTF